MDVSSLLSAVIGGLFALAGVVLTQKAADRARREARRDELVEACRADAMHTAALLRGDADDRAIDVLHSFQRNLISLQAHGKRWEKHSNKQQRGFAATISSLSARIAGSTATFFHGSGRDEYLLLLDALTLACVYWEQQPATFTEGDLAESYTQKAKAG